MKYFAVVAIIVLAIMMVAPIAPVKAGTPPMNVIQYRYFANQAQLFTALLIPDSFGGIDIMDWPLTNQQYTSMIGNPSIQLCATPETNEFELAFNNNWTDGVYSGLRSPMNYTDFRNAMNCLVNKTAVINGPILGGSAYRDDTQIPEPLMGPYVNPAVSYLNYPWEFNVTYALQILYNGGWYNHAVYPTLNDLLNVYAVGGLSGNLTGSGTGPYFGNANTVVYSGNDPNGQWGGSDPQAAANAAIANTPLNPLMGYVRSNDARLDLGNMFCAELNAIGCPYTEIYKSSLTALKPYVITAQYYDFATLGYTRAAPPNWWYMELTPAGISPGGDNCYLVDDWNMTYWATKAYNDPTIAGYLVDINNVQDILVMESELVSVYSPTQYNAYKAGMLGVVDELGYSLGGQAHSQLLNWLFLNCRTPGSNTIYYGELNPPDMINPIFSGNIFDSEVEGEIFSYPIAQNPYTVALGSAITGFPAGGDLPWMAYSWSTSLVANPGGVDGAAYPGPWTNVTLWFRNDITWQDGYPFTVTDVNYTIYINALYGDSYDNAAMLWAVNNTGGTYLPYFQQDFTPQDPTGSYTCSILVKSTSWTNLYVPDIEILPEHLYKYIVPYNLADQVRIVLGTATDGLHGLWPGQAAVAGNVLPNLYFTPSTLNSNPQTTLVGTGPFKYRLGSTSAGSFVLGGGITLDAYSNFPMTFVGRNREIARGAIAFRYTWLNSNPNAQPSGGYYKVGLWDLVLLARAWGTTGTAPPTGGINGVPGQPGVWNPAANIAAPSCRIGLPDLFMFAQYYGWYYGNYSYNAPYPPSEVANGGP